MLPAVTKLATAVDIGEKAKEVGNQVGLQTGTISETILTVISWLLFVAGGVAILLLIIGGIFYITAAGDATRLERAKAIVRSSIIGLVVILISAVIVITVNLAITGRSGRSRGGLDTPYTRPVYIPRNQR